MFKSKKYKFFEAKVEAVQKNIWDFEFKLAKSRQVREGVRMDRDRAVETVHQIEAQLEGTKDKEIKKKLQEQLDTWKENVKRYEAQMKMIDDEIDGGVPTSNNPAGVGVLETIKSMVELREMYKSYLKSL